MENVILVDEQDNEIGIAEKYATHRLPVKLHRAFSIFIFNSKGEMLLARRARSKYHWGGFWSNACCSHPRPSEPVDLATKRRLEEELGFTCDLRFLFKFIYRADFDGVWGEHELDYAYVGKYDGPVNPNPNEVEETRFMAIDDLKKDIEENPEKYTPWFKICLGRVLASKGM